MTQLFRKKAIDHSTQGLFGDSIIVQPISFWVVTSALLLFIVFAVFF